jgi:hypothetical protein
MFAYAETQARTFKPAFAHASICLGVFGHERFHYWGLLLWTFW